jgi:hypothetical protein
MSSNPNIGLFAASTTFHQVGFSLNYRSFNTFLYGVEHSSERLSLSSLNVRWQLTKRVQFLASVPHQLGVQKTATARYVVSGLGDPTLIGNFIVVDKKDTLGLTRQFLSFGAGSKLPLGLSTNPDDELKNMYPGTGSTDFLLLSNYLHQFNQSLGFQAEMSYVMRGADQFAYQLGNSFSLQSQIFYRKKHKSKLFISSFGLQFDEQEPSTLNRIIPEGNPNNMRVLSARSGFNVLVNRWLWSAQLQLPLYQKINGGTVKQVLNGTIGMNYFITKKQRKND